MDHRRQPFKKKDKVAAPFGRKKGPIWGMMLGSRMVFILLVVRVLFGNLVSSFFGKP